MAKRDSTSERTISKAQRCLKIGYVSIRHFYHHNYTATWYSRSPSLRLNGNWLEEAGFTTGTPLDVRVMPGCLVITTRSVETPLMKELNNISQLPQEEQQQAMAFLQGVAARVALETA